MTLSRKELSVAPRDNLIYELGLLVAYLGKKRTFPIVPKDCKIKLPSDLLGTSPLPYDFLKGQTKVTEIIPHMEYACARIRDHVIETKARPLKAGRAAAGYQSGIRFTEKLVYDEVSKNLRFRIGYQSESSVLLNADIRIYYIHTYPSSDLGLGYSRTWKQLDHSYSPEIRLGWNVSVKLDGDSPIVNILEGRNDAEALKSLAGQIAVYVTGYDSSDMILRHNYHYYKPANLVDRKYLSYYKITVNGDAVNLDWNNFNEFEKID